MDKLATHEAAAELVHRVVPPTPQYCWPLLSRRVGAEIWIKHENHTAIGAFKLRGGLVYLDELKRREPATRGVVTATRGNHGQSIAYAATRLGLAATSGRVDSGVRTPSGSCGPSSPISADRSCGRSASRPAKRMPMRSPAPGVARGRQSFRRSLT